VPIRSGLSGSSDARRMPNDSLPSRPAVLRVERTFATVQPCVVKNWGPLSGANFSVGTSSPNC
jgi:hypothetical protein